MKKALFICEFSRDDCENESEWFVSNDDMTFEMKAYEHLANIFDMTIKETKETVKVVNVYRVDDNLIKEVYESK